MWLAITAANWSASCSRCTATRRSGRSARPLAELPALVAPDSFKGTFSATEVAAGIEVELDLLCDVRTPFEDAARVFGPQKGADAAMVRRLSERLDQLAQEYKRDPRGEPM